MRSTKTTIRFKLSRAEDARALEYLRAMKATGSSFSKSVVQAINDCLDAQETESREDSFMGRFRLMLREELKGLGGTAPFQPLPSSPGRPRRTLRKRWRFWMLSTTWNEKMTAFFQRNAITMQTAPKNLPPHFVVCDGKFEKHGGIFSEKHRQESLHWGGKAAYLNRIERILSFV